MKKVLLLLLFALIAAPLLALNWGQIMRFYGLIVYVPLAATIADDGAGTAAASTLTTPTRRAYSYTCSDAHGCDLTLGETNVFDGQQLTIYNVGSNTLNLADTSGVSELNSAYAMAQYDFITLEYQSDRWVEASRSVSGSAGLAEPLTLTDATNVFKGASYTGPTANPADAGVLRCSNNEVCVAAEAPSSGTDATIKYSSSSVWDFTSEVGASFRDAGSLYANIDQSGNISVRSDSAFMFSNTNQATTGRDTFMERGKTGFVEFSEDRSVDGGVIYAPDARTIADTGDANPATLSLTVEGSYVPITCSDADTCDITFVETGAIAGQISHICNVAASTGVVDFADTSGVSELAGAFAADVNDCITVIYVVDRFVELSRSNN